jgi:hypothetical protein
MASLMMQEWLVLVLVMTSVLSELATECFLKHWKTNIQFSLSWEAKDIH